MLKVAPQLTSTEDNIFNFQVVFYIKVNEFTTKSISTHTEEGFVKTEESSDLLVFLSQGKPVYELKTFET